MTEREAIRAAAFAYGRKLADPRFRELVQAISSPGEQAVVVALPHERAMDVLDRMVNKTTPPAIIAIKIESEPSGFGFLRITPTTEVESTAPSSELEDNDAILLGETTSIEMLFAAARAYHRNFRIPNSWWAVTYAA